MDDRISGAEYQNLYPKDMDNEYKKCPYCAEKILKEANVCRYCSRKVRWYVFGQFFKILKLMLFIYLIIYIALNYDKIENMVRSMMTLKHEFKNIIKDIMQGLANLKDRLDVLSGQ